MPPPLPFLSLPPSANIMKAVSSSPPPRACPIYKHEKVFFVDAPFEVAPDGSIFSPFRNTRSQALNVTDLSDAPFIIPEMMVCYEDCTATESFDVALSSE